MKVEVIITEVLSRMISIDVPDGVEDIQYYAEKEASKKYQNEEIVLDYEDHVETEIKAQVSENVA